LKNENRNLEDEEGISKLKIEIKKKMTISRLKGKMRN
jgi:hypothetical protein